MANKKKLKNVQINNQELMPTTIGYLENKQKGPFLLLIIFAILFATVYYMPRITEQLTGNDIPNDGNPVGENYDDEAKVFIFNTETIIKVKNLEFSNININQNKISILVSNTKDMVTPLTNYYIVLYDNNDKVLERIDISNESLNKYGKRTFTYNVNNQDEITKISINIINSGNYPSVELKEENGQQILICSNNSQNYKYEFQSKKLKRVTKTVYLKRSDFNDIISYESEFNHYLVQAENFPINGIVSTFSNTPDDFTFTQTIDLSKVFAENVEDTLYYVLDETPEKIAFQNSLKKYKCY